MLKDFEEATGLVTQGGRLVDILFLFALVSATIKVRFQSLHVVHIYLQQETRTASPRDITCGDCCVSGDFSARPLLFSCLDAGLGWVS